MNNVLENLELMFPDACCELNYENGYQLLSAVMLSAQTTDKQVNKVTIELFKKYPDIETLSKADILSVEDCIRSLGLYHNKAKNLILMANKVWNDYSGVIPNNFDDLVKLPGVGRKTANVYLGVFCNVPRIPVDTHVERVSKRLGLVPNEATVLETELRLMEIFPEDTWMKLHHQLIFLGRYICKAQKPMCAKCKFDKQCDRR